MHVYDAPNPWGPWTTVYYNNTWGGYGTTRALLWHVISKFISADNRTFWVAFSGYSTPVNFDNLNLIKGTFTVAAAATPPPGGVVVVPQPPTMRTLTAMKQRTGSGTVTGPGIACGVD